MSPLPLFAADSEIPWPLVTAVADFIDVAAMGWVTKYIVRDRLVAEDQEIELEGQQPVTAGLQQEVLQ